MIINVNKVYNTSLLAFLFIHSTTVSYSCARALRLASSSLALVVVAFAVKSNSNMILRLLVGLVALSFLSASSTGNRSCASSSALMTLEVCSASTDVLLAS